MRTSIPHPPCPELRWAALAPYETFLYRRIGDLGQAVLGIGERPTSPDDWLFGHMAYDLKDRLDGSRPQRAIHQGYPDEHWFCPRFVVEWGPAGLVLHVHPEDEVEGKAFMAGFLGEEKAQTACPWTGWQPHTDKATYLAQARRVMAHIRRGDVYELNLCFAHQARVPDGDPFTAFPLLLERTDAPHAAFHRLGQRFALCASPERFLRMAQRQLLGQPMKGTRPRCNDPVDDRAMAEALATDPKERAENIMAVDVMRHDLSRVAARGTVRVNELCAVKTLPSVYQMVSNISATLREGLGPMDALYAAFPMASMTGAPKVRAMQLIDELEELRRGMYSGTFGFIAPDGTADFNVVIRTVLFDADTGNASLFTGSALTAACDPEAEWEECLLKANYVIDALQP